MKKLILIGAMLFALSGCQTNQTTTSEDATSEAFFEQKGHCESGCKKSCCEKKKVMKEAKKACAEAADKKACMKAKGHSHSHKRGSKHSH